MYLYGVESVVVAFRLLIACHFPVLPDLRLLVFHLTCECEIIGLRNRMTHREFCVTPESQSVTSKVSVTKTVKTISTTLQDKFQGCKTSERKTEEIEKPSSPVLSSKAKKIDLNIEFSSVKPVSKNTSREDQWTDPEDDGH
ncbi:hypothetical protein OUZ56_010357 [Daphnia magna]|uniref:Uncharacterized protein n=1 Tax=Daphnia magna TaxID=35525 RepID=A0ABR0AIB0_9CRUS|nr:hypothetical protein OUZ56_010357 [Daphnia magna]